MCIRDRPSTSRNDEIIDQVQTLVMEDLRITVQEIAAEVGINISFWLYENICKIYAKAVNDEAEVNKGQTITKE